MSRPPRADAAAVNVVVRFSPDELADAKRLAEAHGVTLSWLLRALVARAVHRAPKTIAASPATGKRGRPKGVAGKRKGRKG